MRIFIVKQDGKMLGAWPSHENAQRWLDRNGHLPTQCMDLTGATIESVDFSSYDLSPCEAFASEYNRQLRIEDRVRERIAPEPLGDSGITGITCERLWAETFAEIQREDAAAAAAPDGDMICTDCTLPATRDMDHRNVMGTGSEIERYKNGFSLRVRGTIHVWPENS